MPISKILKAWALFVDGRGYAGECEEVTLPKLTIKTEEIRNGGMDVGIEVPMGMEKLELGFTLSGIHAEVLTLFGVVGVPAVGITLRGSVEDSDGTKTAILVEMRGLLKELDPGSWKAGDKAPVKYSVALSYYKYSVGGVAAHEIDPANMIRIVGGTDQLAAERANLGM